MFETLPGLVDALAKAPPTHGMTFLERHRETDVCTWRTLHQRALGRAAALHKDGVRAGDRLLLCLTHDPAVLETFLGALWLGAVPLSVAAPPFAQSREARGDDLTRLVARFDVPWVLAQAETAGATGATELRPRLAEGDAPRAAPTPDDLALVQFSSGSTSRPKGIRLTHGNLSENVRLLVELGRRTPDESLVSWVPLSHDMGLVGAWLSTLAVRIRRLVLMSPMHFLMRPTQWLETIATTRARIATCPPFALDLCVDRLDAAQLERSGADLSALDVWMVGAETVRAGTVRRCEAALAPFGLRPGVITPVYGLAEATLIVTAHTPGTPIETMRVDGTEVVSVGRPLGDFAVRIADAPLPDAPGEVQLRGACVTEGLLDATAEGDLFEDGWLRTGDLGVLDPTGRLYVTGRIKDLLVVDGRNVYAHDVADALAGLPFLRAGRTHTFTAHVGHRKRVVVLAVPRGAARPGAAEVEAMKRRVLARCGLAIDDVLFVRRIPRTSSGKVQRHTCERIYRERSLA